MKFNDNPFFHDHYARFMREDEVPFPTRPHRVRITPESGPTFELYMPDEMLAELYNASRGRGGFSGLGQANQRRPRNTGEAAEQVRAAEEAYDQARRDYIRLQEEEKRKRREEELRKERERLREEAGRSSTFSGGTFNARFFFENDTFLRDYFTDAGFTFHTEPPPHQEHKTSRPQQPTVKAWTRDQMIKRLCELAKVDYPSELPDKRLLRLAQRHSHPDSGGSHDLWVELDELVRLLRI